VGDYGMSDNGQIAALESLALAGLDHAAGDGRATQRAGNRILEAIKATNATIVDGADIRLALTLGDEVVANIVLGPADAIRIASDLLLAGRRRMGRGALAD
jgi:hypothetical protein